MIPAKKFATWLLMLVAGLTPIACAKSDPQPHSEPEPVRVFAAASLTEVVEALAEAYDSPVSASFGGSSALARQIHDGAPADVFLSASPRWIEYLRGEGALEGEPMVLARNRLVAIVPVDAPRDRDMAATELVDGQALLDQLSLDDRIAIADEGVPAGEYARAALAAQGLLELYRPHLVGQTDVRAVLHAVEQGEVKAGFVYSTDARAANVKAANVKVVFAFEPSTHPPIEYQAAALRGAANRDAARAFLRFLQGDSARALLSDAGFELP